MTYFDKKIEYKIFYQSNQYFPISTKINKIIKVENEPYSYWIDKTKIYIFENNDLFNFLTWYWYNYKESFIFDFCDIIYNIPWKYFCEKIPNFKEKYPTVDDYNSQLIHKKNLVEIYDNLIIIVGLDNFINDVIIKNKKYKSMEFRKINNIIYKFATDCGTQIFN